MRVFAAYVVLAVLAFCLHLPWEYLHQPLYSEYEALGSGWKLALWATSGDVAYTLLIALIIAAGKRKLDWMNHARGGDYVAAAFLGFLIALFVEYKAFYLHRWAYSDLMPLIPILHAGVSPVLQMVLLAPLAILLTRVGLQLSREVRARMEVE